MRMKTWMFVALVAALVAVAAAGFWGLQVRSERAQAEFEKRHAAALAALLQQYEVKAEAKMTGEQPKVAPGTVENQAVSDKSNED